MNLKALSVSVVLALGTVVSHAASDVEVLAEKLKKAMPGLSIDALTPSAIPGVYELVSAGDVAYITADGVHMIQGTLFNIPGRKNLTEKTLSVQRVKAMQTIDPAALLVYPAKGKQVHAITVFTDPSCPYCHRLHDEIPKLNEMGVTVRYALYARSGNGTLTARQISEVMCATDKKAVLDRFFANSAANSSGATCKQAESAERIARVANQVGLKGTPYIVADSGFAEAGYMPAAELVKALTNF